MQTQLKIGLDAMPPTVSHRNVFGMGLDVHVYGKGFPWRVNDYRNFSGAADRLLPFMQELGIKKAVVPDFRGMNAFIVEPDPGRLTTMHAQKPLELQKTSGAVDGIWLRKGMSVFGISADCPQVLLADQVHKRVLHLHCSRESLHPLRRDGSKRAGRDSVIDTAMAELMPIHRSQISAFILCGIGPKSFENRADLGNGFYKSVVEHFTQKYGRWVVQGPPDEGRLNLPGIITAQLNAWGVGMDQPEAIAWDGIDTFTDDRFNSRRKSPDGANCVLVNMEHALQ